MNINKSESEVLAMAIREGWNAHNDIGLSMEIIANNVLYRNKPYGADNTIFSADRIEASCFVEAMVCLLRHIYGYACNENIDTFIETASKYFGKSVHTIEPQIAKDLLDNFIELIPSY